MLDWLASWLGHRAAGLVGLARLARLAGRSAWFPGFVGRRLGSPWSDTLDAQESSAGGSFVELPRGRWLCLSGRVDTP